MVNIPKFFKNQEIETTERLPLLPLRDIVVFPHMVAPLFVGRDKSVSALSSAMNKDKRIFLATQRNAGVDNPAKRTSAMWVLSVRCCNCCDFPTVRSRH
jgi:ATP-dependent Lon protease